MYDDRHIGIDTLLEVVLDTRRLVEDHTALLEMMFREDKYKDFLLAEKLQDLSDTSGLDVQPIDQSTGTPDLSPINELLPNVIKKNVAGRIDPTIVNMPSNAGDQTRPASQIQDDTKTSPNEGATTNKLARGGIVSSFPTTPLSLEQTGFDDTFEKNISTKLEDDFQLPAGLKKAFGDSMLLPARAAAVALADLLAKVPVQNEEQKNVINENLNQITNAFNLSKSDVLTTSTINEGSDINNTSSVSSTTNSWLTSLGSTIGSSDSGMIADSRSGGNVGGSGARPNRKLNLLNPFDWPAIMDEADKARRGERTIHDNDRSVPGSILNYNQRNAEYLKMLSSITTDTNVASAVNNITTGSSFENIKNNIINGSTLNTNIAEVSSTNNLTELTERVLTENRARILEKTELAKNNLMAQIPQPPSQYPSQTSANIGDDNANVHVKHSPFFESYTSTAQFS